MGVYLEGMDMPSRGNETIIRIQPGGGILDQYGHHLDCTAIHVPPHGRLGDVDKVKKYLANCAEDRDAIRPPMSWKEAFDEAIGVFNDFSVIPADPAEEGET